ncbi:MULTISPECIES: hypothetical protein [Burkholderia]|uniref:hypothetical protein n=1 Tax=Burkholderia TaxID=32008 RepID=UPI00098238A3|nr:MULTISPECIES: hypothetical protein [Burkholderia]MBG0880147.1 hypothetical protein [Burkholderia sp. 9775_39]MBG0886102.1 hypothetical protein [Burkholderia sp. 9773_38]ONV33600.1 hypothetical protein A8E82_32640 [Burkholderia cenocepacia]PNF00752.1 hypothetical protein A8H27_23990 [Burkholderia cenocepacia]RSC46941.1 hypothetical protein EGT44_14555 [Burkholderia cenocepacia]
MKFSELFGASLTAAIVAGLLIGFLSVKDFGSVSIAFSVVAFAVAFPVAMLLSYPIYWAGTRLPQKVVLPMLVVVGGVVGSIVLAVLTNAAWPNVARSEGMALLYSAIGAMCAVSALCYVERSRIADKLCKWRK